MIWFTINKAWYISREEPLIDSSEDEEIHLLRYDNNSKDLKLKVLGPPGGALDTAIDLTNSPVNCVANGKEPLISALRAVDPKRPPSPKNIKHYMDSPALPKPQRRHNIFDLISSVRDKHKLGKEVEKSTPKAEPTLRTIKELMLQPLSPAVNTVADDVPVVLNAETRDKEWEMIPLSCALWRQVLFQTSRRTTERVDNTQ